MRNARLTFYNGHFDFNFSILKKKILIPYPLIGISSPIASTNTFRKTKSTAVRPCDELMASAYLKYK